MVSWRASMPASTVTCWPPAGGAGGAASVDPAVSAAGGGETVASRTVAGSSGAASTAAGSGGWSGRGVPDAGALAGPAPHPRTHTLSSSGRQRDLICLPLIGGEGTTLSYPIATQAGAGLDQIPTAVSDVGQRDRAFPSRIRGLE